MLSSRSKRNHSNSAHQNRKKRFFLSKRTSSSSTATSLIPSTPIRTFNGNIHQRRMSTTSTDTTDEYYPQNVQNPFEKITLGVGCYWGTEQYFRSTKKPYYFNSLFPGSIIDVKVGFMGGVTANPTYKQVCTDPSNLHVEVAEITFDTSKCDLFDILKYAFMMHDPTTMNRQGGDTGIQYSSIIFVYNKEQEVKAHLVKDSLNTALQSHSIDFKRKFEGDSIVTQILPASVFYPAEEYHQKYLEKNPDGYCNHSIRFDWTAQKNLKSTHEFKELLHQAQAQ